MHHDFVLYLSKINPILQCNCVLLCCFCNLAWRSESSQFYRFFFWKAKHESAKKAKYIRNTSIHIERIGESYIYVFAEW